MNEELPSQDRSPLAGSHGSATLRKEITRMLRQARGIWRRWARNPDMNTPYNYGAYRGTIRALVALAKTQSARKEAGPNVKDQRA